MAEVRAVTAMAVAGEVTELGRRYLHAKFDDRSQSARVADEFAARATSPATLPAAIVPVPSSTTLSADFAAALARRWGVPVVDAVRWTREVPPLKHVPVGDRPALIAAAFTADPVAGTVLVVDDVVRSGATLAEAKRALLAAGAEHVMCVAMLRVD